MVNVVPGHPVHVLVVGNFTHFSFGKWTLEGASGLEILTIFALSEACIFKINCPGPVSGCHAVRVCSSRCQGRRLVFTNNVKFSWVPFVERYITAGLSRCQWHQRLLFHDWIGSYIFCLLIVHHGANEIFVVGDVHILLCKVIFEVSRRRWDLNLDFTFFLRVFQREVSLEDFAILYPSLEVTDNFIILEDCRNWNIVLFWGTILISINIILNR